MTKKIWHCRSQKKISNYSDKIKVNDQKNMALSLSKKFSNYSDKIKVNDQKNMALSLSKKIFKLFR